MTDDLTYASPDELADRWGANRQLTRDTTYYGQASLSGLITSPRDPWSAPAPHEAALLDHSRYFKAPRKRLPSVAVSAPYIANLRRDFGTLASAQARIFELASELGLHARVGLPHDLIWPGSPTSPMGMYPIVWWNSERCDLLALEAQANREDPETVFGTTWNRPMFYLPDHPLIAESFTDELLQLWKQRFGCDG